MYSKTSCTMKLTPCLSNLFYFKYPQFIWALRIRAILSDLSLTPNVHIVDAPCGDGFITYWLYRYFDNPFSLYDLSLKSINRIQTLFPDSKRPTIKHQDIFAMNTYPANDIWLWINSLFCLPNVGNLISKNRQRFQYIICIYDNVLSPNYTSFHTRHSDYPNHHPLMQKDVLSLFKTQGYICTQTDPIGTIHHLKNEIKFPYINRLLYMIYNMLNPIFSTKTPPYFLSVFKRID